MCVRVCVCVFILALCVSGVMLQYLLRSVHMALRVCPSRQPIYLFTRQPHLPFSYAACVPVGQVERQMLVKSGTDVGQGTRLG
jgi:hypothetical protein